MIPDGIMEKVRRACQWLALCLAVMLGVVLEWIYAHWGDEKKDERKT